MTLRAAVYSEDSSFRAYVIESIGATTYSAIAQSYPALISLVDAGGVDLVILDAEVTPAGGVDVARQLKHAYDCPPVLLVVARAADAWLALWSKADATVGPGRDPVALAAAVSRLRPAASRCRR